MADLIDKAEAELSQIMARITMATMQSGLRLSATVGKGVALAPYKVAAAVWNLISKVAHPEQGKVSLRQFTQLTEGKRDVVNLDDKAVSREFDRELKCHGVTWTVEQHRDGSRTFHVQGKDAELIQHALGVAAARVDEKLARGAPELQAEQQPQQEQSGQEQAPDHDGTEQEQPVAERNDQVLDLDEGERSALADELRKYADYREGDLDLDTREYAAELSNDPTYAYDEQATTEALEQEQIAAATPYRELADAAERDEAVTDRGGHSGHSQQREAPAPVADPPPRQLSPRDETRETVAKRIDQDVKAKKEELRQSKTRTRNRTPGRDAATEAREATRRR